MRRATVDTSNWSETYIRDADTRIWIRPGFSGIAYSDGDEVETRIAGIVNNAQDLSILSPELRAQCQDWVTTYHLSPSRANILRPFEDRLQGAEVLEIGAGCGAITRYLGEIGAITLALEGSVRRAAIARSRTRDLSNVDVVSDDFMAFDTTKRFDFITLIGVLEYANLFSGSVDPTLDLLRKARGLLTPGGQLIIAIENQLGLKYFAGSPEDHVGIEFYGIEGHYRKDQVQTFGRIVLQRKLTQAGFIGQRLLLPFPDYKFPTSILNETALTAEDFDAATFAWMNVGSDPQNPQYPAFSQELVWPELIKNGLAKDLSNSFLWTASPASPPDNAQEPLAWHFSVNRKPEFCKVTTFRRTLANNIIVIVRRLVETEEAIHDSDLVFNPTLQSAYLNAPTLDREFGRIAAAQTFDLPKVVSYFRKYLAILNQLATREQLLVESDVYPTGAQKISGSFLDAVPRNILLPDDGTPIYFDREWVSRRPLPVGYVVFRSLLTLFDTITVVGHPSTEAILSFDDLLEYVLQSLGLPYSSDEREKFITLEDHLYGAVFGGTRKSALRQRFDMQLPIRKSRSSDDTLATAHSMVSDDTLATAHSMVSDDTLAAAHSMVSDDTLATAHKALIEFERITRHPWRPLKRTLQVSVLRFLSRLSPPIPKRTAHRFMRSAMKRDLRRLVVPIISAQKTLDQITPLDTRRIVLPIPVFITPNNQQTYPSDLRVGLHVHISSLVSVESLKAAIAEIPVDIRLLLTVSTSVSAHELNIMTEALESTCKMEVHRCDQNVSALEAFGGLIGNRVSDFAVIGSLAMPPAAADSFSQAQIEDALELLIFNLDDDLSGARTALSLIAAQQASLILPRFRRFGASRNREFRVAEATTRKLLNASGYVDNVEVRVVFDHPFMFWVTAELVSKLVALDLTRRDFATSDGGFVGDILAAALLHLSAISGNGIVELCRRDPLNFSPDYEEQVDFSKTIQPDAPNILCYYLPQFHPTPENDEWHGKGFTEWTKVRTAQPLFEGHRQQRVPHGDLGYYQISGTDILKKQSEMMRSAGVHGMVFYHYWFSGRLILEKPVKELLADPSVNMPYCFCWANENWTRRWDGSESEVLLQQNYSIEDATAFIRHLIPYLKDTRYIHHKGRPLIFVYRPALIPKEIPYVEIWKSECRAAGVGEPLVIGTLKDGAKNILARGMEGAVERVLHDWTDGAVVPIDEQLQVYRVAPVGVLDYAGISEFYRKQKPRAEVPVIRSIVPCFDNTPRYGSHAHITHNVSVPIFERWLETLVENTRRDKSIAGDFIVVNAWNEWAETAMIEPDLLNGYGYLNAIGRVLSASHASSKPEATVGARKFRVHLTFSDELIAQIRMRRFDGSDFIARFVKGIINSRESADLFFVTDCPEFSMLNSLRLASGGSFRDIYCRVQSFFVPNKRFFERLSVAALSCPDEQVIAYGYGDHNEYMIQEKGYWGRIPSDIAQYAPVILALRPVDRISERIRLVPSTFAVLLLRDRGIDLLPVSTVVRIHRSGNLKKLERALQCLCAQVDACVSPVVMGQDLLPEQIASIKTILEDLPWREGASPVFENVISTKKVPDLRSKLLINGINRSKSRYQAFLDFDDVLLSDAYALLGTSMKARRKAISFGRTYRSFSANDQLWLTSRDRFYESGGDYTSFISNNMAPIHSYLIDREGIDMSRVALPDDQKYMEDYLMLLQIVNEQNADWIGLKENIYVGDYLHYDDDSSTVSVMNDAKRVNIARSSVYRKCKSRITQRQMEIEAKLGRK